MQAGKILSNFVSLEGRVVRLVFWAKLLAIAFGFTQIPLFYVPINKTLWSLSYVLSTASICFGSFSLLVFLTEHFDAKEIFNGRMILKFSYKSLQACGKNALFLYQNDLSHKTRNFYKFFIFFDILLSWSRLTSRSSSIYTRAQPRSTLENFG